jgi:hypothetical protein
MESYLPLVGKGVCIIYLGPHFLVSSLRSPLCDPAFCITWPLCIVTFKLFACVFFFCQTPKLRMRVEAVAWLLSVYHFSMTSTSPKRPYRLWGSPSVIFSSYRRSSRAQSGRGLQLTTHLHLVPSLYLYSHHTPSWRGEGHFTLFCIS